MGETRTSEVKAGLRDFANRRASILLKRSDYFWSNSEILLSVVEVSTDFLGFDGTFSFFGFFSGGAESILEALESPTTPITATEAGSTRVSSARGIESVRFASRFSFFNLV